MCEFCASADSITAAILIVAFGVLCYLAGKGDLLTLIPAMLSEKLEELINNSTEEKDSDTNEETKEELL